MTARIFAADFKRKTYVEMASVSKVKDEINKQELVERQEAVDEIHAVAQEAHDAGFDITRAILVIPTGHEDGSSAVAEMMGYCKSGSPVDTLLRAAQGLSERMEAEEDEPE